MAAAAPPATEVVDLTDDSASATIADPRVHAHTHTHTHTHTRAMTVAHATEAASEHESADDEAEGDMLYAAPDNTETTVTAAAGIPSDDCIAGALTHTLTDAFILGLQQTLADFYEKHRRPLPWREPGVSPYGIWVSEVMCQQTRVEAVIPYWQRWMERWPTASALAEASNEEVAAAWSGLGYYRRAALIHKGAREVAARGSMPTSAADLKKISGIGDYTAGAIASIAFGEPAALVDGNVVRVLSRIFTLAHSAKSRQMHAGCWQIARKLVPEAHAGNHNQALMELGATVCTPGVPSCGKCPVRAAGLCGAFTDAMKEIDVEDLAADAAAPSKPRQTSLTSFWKPGTKNARSASAAERATESAAVPDDSRIARAAARIAGKYPVKEEKRVTPVHRLDAVIVEVVTDEHNGIGELLWLRDAHGSRTTAAGNNEYRDLLRGHWHPIVLSSMEPALVNEEGGDATPAKAGTKRRRQSASKSATPERLSETDRVACIFAVEGATGWPLAAPGGPLTILDAQTCGRVVHVFSHVTHHIRCILVRLRLSPDCTLPELKPPQGSAVVARVGALPGMGLTTWACKILHPAIAHRVSSAATTEKPGDTSSTTHDEYKEAIALLVQRWKKAGCR